MALARTERNALITCAEEIKRMADRYIDNADLALCVADACTDAEKRAAAETYAEEKLDQAVIRLNIFYALMALAKD